MVYLFSSLCNSYNEKIADANFYTQDKEAVAATLAELAEHQQQLDVLYSRWEELENL